ncbi:unnamed protein product [Candida verbasci]|uniref:N-acetyltransferase domain-containing protein n=1 Tax=Candida verbasci TaxID=1227364 RepID=A0A9W4TRR8_9ASCO|nr:unnamed protein product [Candida verbasci]
MMFALNPEDYHESNSKRKPRSPQSRGVLSFKSLDDSTFNNNSKIINVEQAKIPRSLPENDDEENDSDSEDDPNPSSIINNLNSSRSKFNVVPPDKFNLKTSKIKTTKTHLDTPVIQDDAVSANLSLSSDSKFDSSSIGNKKDRSNSLESITSQPKRRNLTESSFSIPNELNISIEIAKLKDYRRVAKTLMISFEDDPFTNYILNTMKYEKETTSKSIYKKKKLDLMLSYFEYATYECLSTDGLVYIIKDNNYESQLEELDINVNKFPFLGCALWNQIYGMNVSDSSSGSDSDYSDDDYFVNGDLSLKDSIHKSSIKFNFKAIRGQCRSKVFKEKLPFLTKVRNEVLINKILRTEKGKHFPIDLNIWYLNDIATLPSMRGKGLGRILINYAKEKFLNDNKKSYMYLESSNPINRKFYTKMGFKLMKTYSVKYNKYVNEDIYKFDKDNLGINMDAMLYYPEII